MTWGTSQFIFLTKHYYSEIGRTSSMHEIRNAHKYFVMKPEWKTPLVRPMCRREDKSKWVLKERGCKLKWLRLVLTRQ